MRAPPSKLTAEQNELLDLRDRVFELEEANAALRNELAGAQERAAFPAEWRLTKSQSLLLAMLMTDPGGYRTSETLRRGLYPPDKKRCPSVISMMVKRSRIRLRPFGIEILSCRGNGYVIPEASRALIKAAVSRREAQA